MAYRRTAERAKRRLNADERRLNVDEKPLRSAVMPAAVLLCFVLYLLVLLLRFFG